MLHSSPFIFLYTKTDVQLEGEFRDDTFHGHGTVHWPRGQRMDGIWSQGECEENRYNFADGLIFLKNGWKYCQFPDRRLGKLRLDETFKVFFVSWDLRLLMLSATTSAWNMDYVRLGQRCVLIRKRGLLWFHPPITTLESESSILERVASRLIEIQARCGKE